MIKTTNLVASLLFSNMLSLVSTLFLQGVPGCTVAISFVYSRSLRIGMQSRPSKLKSHKTFSQNYLTSHLGEPSKYYKFFPYWIIPFYFLITLMHVQNNTNQGSKQL